MRQFIDFSDHEVLQEQVALIRKNDPVSLFGVVIASALTAYIIFIEIGSSIILYWFALILAITVSWGLLQRLFDPDSGTSRHAEAFTRTGMGVVYSLIWAWMSITYLPQSTPLMLVSITMISGIVVSGSVATQSPFLPQCLGFVGPIMSAIVIGLILRGGPLDLTFAAGGTIYFGALIMCMNTMATTFRDSIELRFDKEALIDQLREALSEIEEATNAKSMLLASASHDLRQPIQAMSLVTEAMKSTELSSYQQELHSHLQSAVDSTHGMLDLLLNFSKVNAGVISANPAPFPVQSVLSRLSSELSPLAQEKKLTYRTRATDIICHSDKQIIEMILRNLITNAIRYTEYGGILVACRARKNGSLAFEVWDTGVGVPLADREMIFKEFRQATNPERESQKGFGLGLAISQGLAHAIESEITVDSRPGRGSVFRFNAPSSSSSVIDDTPEICVVKDFQNKSILVIDDNEKIRVSMRTLLESWGCDCVATDSTKNALEYITHRQPDLLLVDYRLRDNKTGIQAVNYIRTFLSQDIPAIIITGDTTVDQIDELKGARAEVMHKPVSATKLKGKISALL